MQMPGIINPSLCVPQAGATRFVSKLVDEVELPLSALQHSVATARVCGLSKVASQQITGPPHARPNHYALPRTVNVEAVCKPRLPENLEHLLERAVPDYGSSGSDHDPSSVSLFAMVHEFIENNGVAGEQAGCNAEGAGCLTSNKGSSTPNGPVETPQTIQSLALCRDSTEEVLLRDTKFILHSIAAERKHVCDGGSVATMAHSCIKRTLMRELQKMGYAAAMCKTKWDHFCGIPAGDYEYIDVLIPSGVPSKLPDRLLVDINFQAEFEIARPTEEFTAAWQLLPPIFVGRAERLKQIIQIMSDATKQSMRAKSLHLPPWRKSDYLKSKWFSSYKRTANTSSDRPCREGEYCGNGLGFAARGGGLDAKCTNSLETLYHDAGSKHVTGGSRDLNIPQREREEITVMITDWQPPAIVPRCMAPSKQGRITGLTSLLLNARAPSCNEALVQAA